MKNLKYTGPFFSEFGEDEWIAKNISLPEFGTYVDLGCAEPEQFNNTAWLRRSGWQGIAVDANPGYAARWGTPFIAAVIGDYGLKRFCFYKNSAMSRIVASADQVPNDASVMHVQAQPLEDILQNLNIGKIDFLSVDLEGAEYDALMTMNWNLHCPEIIVAEYSTLQEGGAIKEDNRLLEALTKVGGYRVVHKTQANHIYLRV